MRSLNDMRSYVGISFVHGQRREEGKPGRSIIQEENEYADLHRCGSLTRHFCRGGEGGSASDMPSARADARRMKGQRRFSGNRTINLQTMFENDAAVIVYFLRASYGRQGFHLDGLLICVTFDSKTLIVIHFLLEVIKYFSLHNTDQKSTCIQRKFLVTLTSFSSFASFSLHAQRQKSRQVMDRAKV
jgi:hypothetical protein